MASKISVRREGKVAVLQLDDGKANTFELTTFQEMLAHLDTIAASDAGALLLTGRPGSFSAGLDLRQLPVLGAERLPLLIQEFARVMLRVFGFPRPVVAAVTGHAMGAGAILALAADVRFQADGAFRFAMNEVQIGMTVPTFGCEIARASVPPQVHADLVLHGKTFAPAELLARQMVEAVVDADKVFSAALARAQGLADIQSQPYSATKQLMRGAALAHATSVLVPESFELVKPFIPAG